MSRFLSFLMLFCLLTACEDDDGPVPTPSVRITNDSGLDLTDLQLDNPTENNGVDFGAVADGATTAYFHYPTGDACSFSLRGTGPNGGDVQAGALCIVADPLEEGATYTLRLLPPVSVPAQTDVLNYEYQKD